MNRTSALIGLALGLVVGFAASQIIGSDAPGADDGDVERSRTAAENDPSSSEGDDVDMASPGARTPANAPGDSSPREAAPVDVLFSEMLLAHATRGIAKGWSSVRDDAPTEEELEGALETFREQTLALPNAIGVAIARRRSEEERAREDASRGGVMDTLARLEAGESSGPFFDVVGDGATFDRFFVAKHSGPASDGPSILGSTQRIQEGPVADGSTLTFPAGVFKIQDFGKYWRNHYPRDMTIRGAGKTATLLVFASDLSAYDVVHNLTFERCTVHANDNYMFDVREPSMSLTLREVRVTGWDMGAGGSCLFGTEALALRAIDCDFLGGYGRSPGSGRLFDVRHDGLLARFERCLVERTDPFRGVRDGSTIVFIGGELRDVWAYPREIPDFARLNGTAVHWLENDELKDEKRDLDDLFPGWEDALRR